jgi:hypothetical protein
MERSVLRVRQIPHTHPDRKGETIVEVWRGGQVVATIYGSLEGVNVVSERAAHNEAFKLTGAAVPIPSWVVPLLERGEPCPWCKGAKIIRMEGGERECPVCRRPQEA